MVDDLSVHCLHLLEDPFPLVDYGKCPKTFFSIPFCKEIFLFMQLFLAMLNGIVNSVDPDHTAV